MALRAKVENRHGQCFAVYLRKVQARFQKFVSEHGLFEPNQKVLAAVSGGADSVVLARLLAQVGTLAGIAHVNFGLRGADSLADQQFVEALANELAVPCFITQFNTKTIAAQEGESLQMAARRLRYTWFGELLDTHQLDAVAVGTHATDQAETMLLNLARGTGVAGLHGIFAKRGNVVRPLLFATAAEIRAFAQQQGWPWREDVSNKQLDYQRNLLRNKALPVFAELNSDFERTMQHNAQRMADAERLMQHTLDAWWRTVAREEAGRTLLSIDALEALSELGAALYYWLSPLGFNRVQTDTLAGLLRSQPGRFVESETHRALRDRQHIIIAQKEALSAPEAQLLPATRDVLEPVRLTCCRLAADQASISTDASVACLDFDALQFPLTLRKWQPGDRFQPLGMQGTKKLSDFLIDARVPLTAKNNVFVLCSGNEIAWVVGHRISQKFCVGPQTKTVYQLACKNAV